MPTLDKDLYNKIVEMLVKIPLIKTPDKRSVLIDGAFFGENIVNHIDLTGSPFEFASHLVKTLHVYGGETAIWTLLDYIRDEAGADKQEAITSLSSGLNVQRAGSVRATIYRNADDVGNLTRFGLVGRDSLKAELLEHLTGENARVLMQGFGGVGKTAIAAHIAATWLDANGGAVLWHRIGTDAADTVLEALAHPFNVHQQVATNHSENKQQVLRQAIRESDVRLIILDDVWNGNTLTTVQKAIPRDVPLLVTSRQRYPLNTIIRIPDLAPDDAFALLRKIAGADLTVDETASRELCEEVGYLAFAIEMAGATMKAQEYPASKMLAEIQDKVIDMEVPLEYSDKGRESVAALIETTLNVLPEDAKKAFLAWGAFWSRTITPELLKLYFEAANAREVDAEDMLNQCSIYGLASRHPAEMDGDYPKSVAYYQLQNLAFDFATAQVDDVQRNHAVGACLAYAKAYRENSRENFAALEPEVDNFMGASRAAMQGDRYSIVENFTQYLYREHDNFRVLYYRGFYNQSIELLNQTVSSAEKEGRKNIQALHLSNLGITYSNLAQYKQAMKYFKQALRISRDIGERRYEGIVLGNLGHLFYELGKIKRAGSFFKQALGISREVDDKFNIGDWLCGLGNVYADIGRVEDALQHYDEALNIRREIGDARGTGAVLGNMGYIFSDLGDTPKAIHYYEQALTIGRDIGDRRGEGIHLGNLGTAYTSLGQFQKSKIFYEQALSISRKIGDKVGEAYNLNNIGQTYEYMKDYLEARNYFEQSLAILQEINNPHLIDRSKYNLARIQAILAEQENSNE